MLGESKVFFLFASGVNQRMKRQGEFRISLCKPRGGKLLFRSYDKTCGVFVDDTVNIG